MKTKFYFILLLLFGLTAKGFSQTASFTMSDSMGCGPLCISFSDQSTNPVSWAWDFGDASAISTQQNPMHCYTSAGMYTVTLTVTFASSTATATQSVYVFPAPVAAFTYSVSGNTVTITDQSTGGPANWYWSFGDATTSTSQNPVHTYTQSGNHTVCLFVMNQFGCGDSTCMPVMVTAIQNYETDASWNLFPNPSENGQFTIQLNSSTAQQSLVIENVLGEKVLQEEISGTTEIDLSGQASGIYFVRLGNGPAQKIMIK
jgi:PKD repeat protein